MIAFALLATCLATGGSLFFAARVSRRSPQAADVAPLAFACSAPLGDTGDHRRSCATQSPRHEWLMGAE
jgi:hypothetical protein